MNTDQGSSILEAQKQQSQQMGSGAMEVDEKATNKKDLKNTTVAPATSFGTTEDQTAGGFTQ